VDGTAAAGGTAGAESRATASYVPATVTGELAPAEELMEERHPNSDLRSEIRNGLERLRALQDEARVQAHLAGMDIKKRWDAMQPQLQGVELAAQQAIEHATEASREVVADGVKALEDFLAAIRHK
jgi:hypothetical protein